MVVRLFVNRYGIVISAIETITAIINISPLGNYTFSSFVKSSVTNHRLDDKKEDIWSNKI